MRNIEACEWGEGKGGVLSKIKRFTSLSLQWLYSSPLKDSCSLVNILQLKSFILKIFAFMLVAHFLKATGKQ